MKIAEKYNLPNMGLKPMELAGMKTWEQRSDKKGHLANLQKYHFKGI